MTSGTAAPSRIAAIAIAITTLAAACGGGGAPIDRDAVIAEADRQCDLQLAPASAGMRDSQNASDFEGFLNVVESVTIPALESAIQLTDPGDFPPEDRAELEALHDLRHRELAALADAVAVGEAEGPDAFVESVGAAASVQLETDEAAVRFGFAACFRILG